VFEKGNVMSEVNSTPEKPVIQPPRQSGVVIPHSPKWHQRLAAWAIYVSVRLVAATLRYRLPDRSGFYDNPPTGQAIYATWHNRLALCFTAYFRHASKHSRTSGLAVMISASKDGAFLAESIRHFGVQPARGSTSRRGTQALRELVTWTKRGYDLGITPDGPRGPRYVVQDGVIYLAQLTRLPIIPLSYKLGWKIRVKSWDRFQIPLPFSRCEIFYGKPIYVPRETTDTEREELRKQLEQALKEISPD
jgi:lysophospholipid acyltransferase (LPLAT)-like uncharacterized protein